MTACKEEVAIKPNQNETKQATYSSFVDSKTAEIVAKNAYKSSNTFRYSNKVATRTENTPQREILSSYTISTPDRQAAAYAFNYKDGGWAIISADKHFMPILAYNETGTYTDKDKNNGVLLWEAEMQHNIQEARRTNPITPDAVIKEWQNLICLPDPIERISTEKCYGDNEIIDYFAVQPLLRTEWDQGCVYNALCPNGTDVNNCYKAPTGCVATAQAQTMFYHRKPLIFNWLSMPVPGGFFLNNNNPNWDVSYLMRHIGYSVRMSYGSKGSETDTENIIYSLKNDYGYSSADWIDYTFQPIEHNLRWGLPVVLRGRQKQFLGFSYDGHAWVIDGFQKTVYVTYTMVLSHMNWGWGGISNGWYAEWNPTSYNFQYGRKAIINIRP